MPNDNEDYNVQLCLSFFAAHPELPMVSEVWDPLVDWVAENKLVASLANFETAYTFKRTAIALAIDKIPANDYKERVVNPEFARRKKAEPEPRESRPFGTSSYSSWIHSR